jgi:hypothetical protein
VNMRCEECNTLIEEGCTYPRNDFNMFTMKPMVSMWYICTNENCGVSGICPDEEA